MRSTGEVMGIDADFGTAFAKAQAAAYGSLPTRGRVVRVGRQPGQAAHDLPGQAAGRPRLRDPRHRGHGRGAARLERRERRQPRGARLRRAGAKGGRGTWRADHGYDKDAIGKRLRRIEGQVRGIEKMVDEERYCIDILTQVGAAMTALENVGLKVLDDHVNHCVAGALASGDEAQARAKTDELLAAVQRFAKTR